jgi:hypothetical protein
MSRVRQTVLFYISPYQQLLCHIIIYLILLGVTFFACLISEQAVPNSNPHRFSDTSHEH